MIDASSEEERLVAFVRPKNVGATKNETLGTISPTVVFEVRNCVGRISINPPRSQHISPLVTFS